MANSRLSMRKITEALRLHHECNRSRREIARAIGASPTTVGQHLRRAGEAGIGYPLPDGLDGADLECRLFPSVPPADLIRTEPDWAAVHRELRRKSVTLDLLWQEYKADHPDGYRYSWFCIHYRQHPQGVRRWVPRCYADLARHHAAGI